MQYADNEKDELLRRDKHNVEDYEKIKSVNHEEEGDRLHVTGMKLTHNTVHSEIILSLKKKHFS